MSSKLGRIGGLTKRVTFPEKWKGGRMEKIGNYFHVIYTDYKMVFVELLDGMKEKPIKSAFYISLLTGLTCLFKTNPSENDFKTMMIENANELAMVGDGIRNPSSDNYMQNLIHHYKDGRLHYINLGLCSLLYVTDYSNSLGLYRAKCNHLKPHWTELHKTILDVGVLGKWVNTEEAMKDYDINTEEWSEK